MAVVYVQVNGSGERFPVNVEAEDTVWDVKKKIENQRGSVANSISLKAGGVTLVERHKLLERYQIENKAVLSMEVTSCMQVMVDVALEGRKLVVEVGEGASVAQLKDRIYERSGIPAHLQRLLAKSKQLDDDERLLSSYQLLPGEINVVTMVHRLKGGQVVRMKVEVEGGGCFETSFSFQKPIQQLMEHIGQLEGKDPRGLELFFQGQKMEADKTLRDYGFTTDSCIHAKFSQAE